MTHVDGGLAAKRPGAGEHLVKQHAGRKDIGARIDAIAARLFRRRVSRRAVGHADLGQLSLMNAAGLRFRFVEQFGQAKIQDLCLATFGDHHVAGFDIAMNDAARVRRGQRVRHLNPDAQSAFQFQWPPVNQLAHVFSFDVLHRNEVQTFGFVEIEDRADVRMIERRREPCFPGKTFQVGVFDGQFRRQDFDHDGAAQLVVGGFINRALSAGAELLENLVIAESLPDHEWRYLTPK